jgi:hypothetical protein
MRWRREEYLELMTFGRVERQMFVELFGPLVGLEDEWLAPGASEDEMNLTAFDWDFVVPVGCGGQTGMLGAEPPVTIEETDEYLVQRDSPGRTTKLCKGAATIALPLDYPVKTMDDWLRLKPRYEFAQERVDEAGIEAARTARAEGCVVVAHIPGAYDTPRQLMGDEAACVAYRS